MSDHPSLSELDGHTPFADRHIGLRPDDVATMLARVGYDSLDDLMAAAVPGAIRSERLDLPAAALRAGRGRRAAGPGGRQPAGRDDDRPRLPRHHHPTGDPAQRARGPQLVHRLHALPARDLPGPARGAAQLPDGRRRPHRAADRQRVPARRGHRRRRGDDARPSRQPEGVRPLRRRRRHAAADHRRGPHPGRGDGHRGRGRRPDRRAPRRRAVRPAGGLPGRIRARGRPAPADRCGPRARRPGRGDLRPAGADAARGARGARGRHRGRVVPALRGAVVLRRPARRLHVGRPRAWSGTCRVGSSASPSTSRAAPPTGWPCRPASSTSAATRRPPTSAPRRCCSPWSPPCTPSTTAPRG